jgi:hypothetical protein
MAIRISFFKLSAAALMMSAAASVQAAELDATLDDKAALSDEELADMRGGFLTAGGAQFDFGASIKTMVNGQVALQTSLQWTNTGAVTQQMAGLGQSIRSQVNNVVASSLAQAGIASPVGNAAGGAPSDVTSTAATNVVDAASHAASAAAAPTQAAAATEAAAAAGTSSSVSPVVTAAADPAPSTASSTTSATASSTVGGPAVVTGVEIPGLGGSTQVFANLNPSQIQSIILNSASNQNITQNTDITFMIYNFQAWQQQLAERTVSARLASEMLSASGFSAGH